MHEQEPGGGDILVYAKVRNPDAKLQLRQLLDDLPGVRVTPALYELFTSDWDEGLWEEEVERMRALIDPDVDTLIFWQVVAGKLVRTCVAGRFA
jgi:hypothetical protein